MNPEDQKFEAVRRLLALKRHEQPPPAYFHGFSQKIILRIQAGERASASTGIFSRMPWMQSLQAFWEEKPLLAGSLGLAVCSLVAWLAAFSDTAPGIVDVPGAGLPTIAAVAQGPSRSLGFQLAVERGEPDRSSLAGFSSTNGGILPTGSRDSLFNSFPPLRAQTAGLHFSAH